MLSYYILKKGLVIISQPHFVNIFQGKYFLYLILLIDQISLPDCLYYFRNWAICVLELFVSQVVTS